MVYVDSTVVDADDAQQFHLAEQREPVGHGFAAHMSVRLRNAG